MSQLVYPPKKFTQECSNSIFLAGSIESGKAFDWQNYFVKKLVNHDVTFINPRRFDWDNSQETKIDNPYFVNQVQWELDGIDYADYIFMYFDISTKSAITLLELGIIAATNPEKLIVVCNDKYWRKGNVDIICDRFNVTTLPTLNTAIDHYSKIFI